MPNFQDTFERQKRSFVSALRALCCDSNLFYHSNHSSIICWEPFYRVPYGLYYMTWHLTWWVFTTEQTKVAYMRLPKKVFVWADILIQCYRPQSRILVYLEIHLSFCSNFSKIIKKSTFPNFSLTLCLFVWSILILKAFNFLNICSIDFLQVLHNDGVK